MSNESNPWRPMRPLPHDKGDIEVRMKDGRTGVVYHEPDFGLWRSRPGTPTNIIAWAVEWRVAEKQEAKCNTKT